MRPQLYRLVDWFVECDVDMVVMESTGVYWIPIFALLDARGLEAGGENPPAYSPMDHDRYGAIAGMGAARPQTSSRGSPRPLEHHDLPGGPAPSL